MPVMTAPESALEELLAEAKVMSRKFADFEVKFRNQFVLCFFTMQSRHSNRKSFFFNRKHRR